ncbi:MAG: 4Fe-4S binding protein [Planctomycetota bacterium]|jgi:epoxyqueuosine reductase QueG
MISSEDVKKFAYSIGAEKCGDADVDRFRDAPKGFHPKDIYKDSQSVFVFLKQMPTEVILATNPVPYTNTAFLLYRELDKIGVDVCRFMQSHGQHAIPIPADNPYLYWDEKNKRGQGIISLRHSAYLAGLGILGRNTLLINSELGNMVYIGAVLTNVKLEPDQLVENLKCPSKCTICINACPQKALDGVTVNQKLCRQISLYQSERGFDIYDCNACRKSCILRTGKQSG